MARSRPKIGGRRRVILETRSLSHFSQLDIPQKTHWPMGHLFIPFHIMQCVLHQWYFMLWAGRRQNWSVSGVLNLDILNSPCQSNFLSQWFSIILGPTQSDVMCSFVTSSSRIIFNTFLGISPIFCYCHKHTEKYRSVIFPKCSHLAP